MTNWKDVKEFPVLDNCLTITHINPKLYHLVVKKNAFKNILDWFWKKLSWSIPENYPFERPIHQNIIKEMCDTGWAAHLVKWDNGQYIVDLTSLEKYSDYGCLLKLDRDLNPFELISRGIVYSDCTMKFVIDIFLKSCMMKVLLIDNVLETRFIFGDNLMATIKKYKLPNDLKNFLLPWTFKIVKTNQFIYNECMCKGGIFEQLFPKYESFMSNEYDFCVWSNPIEMYNNNSLENVMAPSWYGDAITYWNVVETFVKKWLEIFLNTVSLGELQIVENWLTEFYGFVLDLTESLRQVLTRLLWTMTFFSSHVSINGLYSILSDKKDLLIYYASMTEQPAPQVIGSLWKLQDLRYKEIWIEFENVVESLEFNALGLLGGELKCCF